MQGTFNFHSISLILIYRRRISLLLLAPVLYEPGGWFTVQLTNLPLCTGHRRSARTTSKEPPRGQRKATAKMCHFVMGSVKTGSSAGEGESER